VCAVSCRAWLVSDANTGKPLLWHKPTDRLQPASITKVVTSLVVLDYIESQAKAASKGCKKAGKGSVARMIKTQLLDTKCRVSDYGASFASWQPGIG
jgi:D-alanyl-D-alanine carboxypeptidase